MVEQVHCTPIANTSIESFPDPNIIGKIAPTFIKLGYGSFGVRTDGSFKTDFYRHIEEKKSFPQFHLILTLKPKNGTLNENVGNNVNLHIDVSLHDTIQSHNRKKEKTEAKRLMEEFGKCEKNPTIDLIIILLREELTRLDNYGNNNTHKSKRTDRRYNKHTKNKRHEGDKRRNPQIVDLETY